MDVERGQKPVFSSFADLAKDDAIRETTTGANRTFFATETLKLASEIGRAFQDLSRSGRTRGACM